MSETVEIEREAVLFLHGAGATRMWMPFYEDRASAVDVVGQMIPCGDPETFVGTIEKSLRDAGKI